MNFNGKYEVDFVLANECDLLLPVFKCFCKIVKNDY